MATRRATARAARATRVVGEVPTDNYPVGSLAAAKRGNAPTGDFGSQFFIVTGKNRARRCRTTTPGSATVTKGLDVAKKIESFAAAQAPATARRPRRS